MNNYHGIAYTLVIGAVVKICQSWYRRTQTNQLFQCSVTPANACTRMHAFDYLNHKIPPVNTKMYDEESEKNQIMLENFVYLFVLSYFAAGILFDNLYRLIPRQEVVNFPDRVENYIITDMKNAKKNKRHPRLVQVGYRKVFQVVRQTRM